MLSSLSSGSIGPRPTISSKIEAPSSLELGGVQRQPLVAGEVGRPGWRTSRRISLLVELVELGEVDLVDQPRVQLQPHVELRRRRALGLRRPAWAASAAAAARPAPAAARRAARPGGAGARRGWRGGRRAGKSEAAHQAAFAGVAAGRRGGQAGRPAAATSLTIFDLGRCVAIGPPRLTEAAAASQSEVTPPSALRCRAVSASAMEGAGPNMRLARRLSTICGLLAVGQVAPRSRRRASGRPAGPARSVRRPPASRRSRPARPGVQGWRWRGRSRITQS